MIQIFIFSWCFWFAMFSPWEASPDVQASLDKVQLVKPKVHVKCASSPVAEVQRRGDKVNNRSRKVRLKNWRTFLSGKF